MLKVFVGSIIFFFYVQSFAENNLIPFVGKEKGTAPGRAVKFTANVHDLVFDQAGKSYVVTGVSGDTISVRETTKTSGNIFNHDTKTFKTSEIAGFKRRYLGTRSKIILAAGALLLSEATRPTKKQEQKTDLSTVPVEVSK